MNAALRTIRIGALGIVLAAAANGQAASGVRIAVNARVLSFARVNVRSASTLNVSDADARAGRVVLEHAATLAVVSNRPGYALRFEVIDPEVVEVEVDGLGAPVHVGSEGRRVQVATPPGAVSHTFHTLSYRIRYAAGVTAGERPMPLRVSLEEG